MIPRFTFQGVALTLGGPTLQCTTIGACTVHYSDPKLHAVAVFATWGKVVSGVILADFPIFN
jgi:hypothetical protein